MIIYINGRGMNAPELKAYISELEAENAELREKQESAERQIAEYKRLLKAACEDIKYLINHAERNGKACDRCKYGNEMYCYADDCSADAKWQHEDKALALIGEEGDTE